jgi:hypothetical protein
MQQLTKFIAMVAVLCSSSISEAATLTIGSSTVGWVDPSSHVGGSLNANYFVGNCGDPSCSGPEVRDFFEFSVPTELPAIQSMSLVLSTFTVYTGQSPTVEVTFTSTAGFNFSGLGTGTVYGTHRYSSSDTGTTQVIPFDAAAIVDIVSARGGTFVVSGRVTSPTVFSFGSPDQYAYGYSGNLTGDPTLLVQLQIVSAPEPAALGFFAVALIALAVADRCCDRS